jgi:hypothetical protein
MKKNIILIIILSVLSFNLFPENTIDAKENGFDSFLINYVSFDVAVYISTNDVTISGKLLDVYKDGIVVQSSMLKKIIFINKSSIAYVEIKDSK